MSTVHAELGRQCPASRPWSPRWSWILLFGWLVAPWSPTPVWAQDTYTVAQELPVSLRALVDVRVLQQGKAPSWMEGGPGKMRYGGRVTANGSEAVTRFALSQFALEPSASLPYDITAHAQLNWEADIDTHGDFGTYDTWPRLIEGYLRRQWGTSDGGWGLQGGVLNASFSLENTGPAWTPLYTLTPSALNSWLWEEGRIVGAEAEYWRVLHSGVRLGAFAGAGWGPDQTGILLAQRGWVLSDYLAGINSDLPLPQTGKQTAVFDELDGRPALYVGATARDPWEIGELRLGYYDNLGDRATAGVWETRYGVVGVALQPLPGVEVLAQYLVGTTGTRTNNWDSTFSAWYPLLSYRYRGQRVSVRYDGFYVHDQDGAPLSREHGDAVTAAYLFEFWLRHRLAVEYIYVDSHRTNSALSEHGWQVSYRFCY